MEINKDNINEILSNEEFKTDILPSITGSDFVKTLIDNKADSVYKEKIGTEISTLHKRYDDDTFGIIGERPGNNEDGSKMKTYEFIKAKMNELKTLREQKGSLTKDAEVQRLTGEIEKLKKEGGGSHVQSVFDQAKTEWGTKEQGYLKQISDASSANDSFKKKTEISNAVNQIKFNPDTPESVKKMVLETVEANLIANSKFENDKLVFLKPDGNPALNDKYETRNALEMLSSMEAVKAIMLTDDKSKGGGGADPKITGSIHTTTIEGNDVKKLVLPEGSFKSKMEFNEQADKALFASGLTKRDKDFETLKNKAYKEYNVAKMPIQ